jgi:hypothetical protein
MVVSIVASFLALQPTLAALLPIGPKVTFYLPFGTTLMSAARHRDEPVAKVAPRMVSGAHWRSRSVHVNAMSAPTSARLDRVAARDIAAALIRRLGVGRPSTSP